MGNNRSLWSQHNVWRRHNLRCSKAGNSEVITMTRNLFKNIRYYASSSYLQVLKGLNKNCRETLMNVFVFKCSRAANSIVIEGIWPKFKLLHTFMYVLVTYKNQENQMKNEGARVVTTLYNYILDAQGQLTL